MDIHVHDEMDVTFTVQSEHHTHSRVSKNVTEFVVWDYDIILELFMVADIAVGSMCSWISSVSGIDMELCSSADTLDE